jgi:hypothetical protein
VKGIHWSRDYRCHVGSVKAIEAVRLTPLLQPIQSECVRVGETYLLVSNQYDHEKSRLDIEYTFLSNGRAEVRPGSHQAYTYSELYKLIASAGFDVSTATPWTREAHSVTFLATRR